MTKLLSWAAFVFGAFIVVWMGSAFMGANVLALVVSIAIGAFYLLGFGELRRFQQVSMDLATALDTDKPVTDLDAWLKQLHPSIRSSVRLRILQERPGIPGPSLTPYLIGLLVMLGLIGTFVGMVDTLKGAVFALQGDTDLEAIRLGLAAPMKGLGMAFGTSVAGVTASAVLGLVSTLNRRDRLQVWRQLDDAIEYLFPMFSLSVQRESTFKAVQEQAQSLPEVAAKLAAVATKIEGLGDQLSTTIINQQQVFLAAATTSYQQLATNVDVSLQKSLTESGRQMGESLQPLVANLMSEAGQEVVRVHQRWAAASEATQAQQLQAITLASQALQQHWQAGTLDYAQQGKALLTEMQAALNNMQQQAAENMARMENSVSQSVSDWITQQQGSEAQRLTDWRQALNAMGASQVSAFNDHSQQVSATQQALLEKFQTLVASSDALLKNRQQQESTWLADHQQRMAALAEIIQTELLGLKEAEIRRGDAAVASIGELQQVTKDQLASLTQSIQQPLTELMTAAAESPKAAAEVLEQLRSEMSASLARDNEMLKERQGIMSQLDELAGTLAKAATEQRDAVIGMTESSAVMLNGVSERFNARIDADISRLTDTVDSVAGSTVELASLGETFAAAVQEYQQSNSQLVDHFSRLDTTMQTMADRSDEQMAYYVAQAKEIIEHSLLSQQEMIDQLRRLGRDAASATV